MKLLTVVGARPQFVKAATVSREVALRKDVTEVIVHTGQHYDANMSDVFFYELGIPKPDYNLGIGGGSHGAMTGRQLEAIEAVLVRQRPDRVLVYGDTNSTLAGALAAVKLRIPVAHVEAGLRSFNRAMPEEINRVLTDHAADLLFAPTETAMRNLRKEGLPEERLRLVGDVMHDAALFYRERARAPAAAEGVLAGDSGFVLATIHRAENTDDPRRLSAIFDGMGKSGRRIILPLHPRTGQRLEAAGIVPAGNITIIDPVSYLEMIWLESNAVAIATDSGGVQKEAYYFGKPCVTLRDETEWVETVESGWNRLVGSDAEAIRAALQEPHAPATRALDYGDGHSARAILDEIARPAGA